MFVGFVFYHLRYDVNPVNFDNYPDFSFPLFFSSGFRLIYVCVWVVRTFGGNTFVRRNPTRPRRNYSLRCEMPKMKRILRSVRGTLIKSERVFNLNEKKKKILSIKRISRTRPSSCTRREKSAYHYAASAYFTSSSII